MKKPLKKNIKNKKEVQLDERILPIIASVEKAVDVLDREVSLINDGKLEEMPAMILEKENTLITFEKEIAKIKDSGFKIEKGSPEAKALEVALSKYQEAMDRNSDNLQGVSMALEHTKYLIKESSNHDSNGSIYSKTALKIPAIDKGIVGLQLKI